MNSFILNYCSIVSYFSIHRVSMGSNALIFVISRGLAVYFQSPICDIISRIQ